MMIKTDTWEKLNNDVLHCRKCPRLVEWREKVAREKRRAYVDWTYWGNPVPGFGDFRAKILIIGLAPGAHGSNRTGRMFTGDASGDFLYPALYKAEFCSQSESIHRKDGLTLKKVFITAVCRCAPPGNKPMREEQINCRDFLLREIDLLENLEGIVALGGIAFNNSFDVLKLMSGKLNKKRPKFGHGVLFTESDFRYWLLGSYHPSRQNTQTGRLSKDMFENIWRETRQLIKRNG